MSTRLWIGAGGALVATLAVLAAAAEGGAPAGPQRAVASDVEPVAGGSAPAPRAVTPALVGADGTTTEPSSANAARTSASSVDWLAIPLDEHGDSLGSQKDAFSRKFGEVFMSRFKECTRELPANHPRATHQLELRVRPDGPEVLIESAAMDPKDADAYMRHCLESRVVGVKLELASTDELAGPHRFLFPVRF